MAHAKKQPIEWWEAQARLIGGRCPKCAALTVGEYAMPTRARDFECGVIENCVSCGWEQVILSGKAGVPSQTNPLTTRRTLKAVGPRQSVKLIGAPFKKPTTGRKGRTHHGSSIAMGVSK